MTKTYLHIALSALLSLVCASCDVVPMLPQQNIGRHEHNNMKVVETEFSPDHKTFNVKVKLSGRASRYSLADSSHIRIEAVERNRSGLSTEADMQPVLTHVKNIRQQELAENGLNLLLLVDLTLHEEDIQTEREAIRQIRQWFAPNNLHIAFMSNDGVSATMPLTDYVMDRYFKKSNSQKRLYRAILEKRGELASWTRLKPEQKGLIVFSDGKIYQSDLPIDPSHYDLQQQLLHASNSGGYSAINYVNVACSYEEGETNEAKPVLQQMALHTHGIYLDQFDWNRVLDAILKTYHVQYADYQLDFVNPDHKIYVGKKNHLQIRAYEGGKLLYSGCAEYTIGNVYAPVIIHGLSNRQVMLQGLVITLLAAALAYLILQLLVPYVSYRLFKRKYITRYTNQSMVFNGIQVSQSCYYCKAPFEEGDEIVARCKHVVHRECWDENEYKCPEHGRHCKEGSHYYNDRHLFDRRNAPYYTRWVGVAILAGLVSWVCFLSFSMRPSGVLLNEIMLSIHNLKPGTAEAQAAYDTYAKHLNMMPVFGLSVNFCLTLALSLLCHRQPMRLRLQWAAVKALIASLLGYLVFLLVCIVAIIMNNEEDTLLLDWTPWILNAVIITFASSYLTRVKLRLKSLGISAIVAIAIFYVWDSMFFDSHTDNRVLMLFCFLVYAVALFLSLAVNAPRSERYFLHIEGATKPLDIALYKWMRTSPDYRMLIGKSVDCQLQMTWDFSPIAPQQAVIYSKRGKLYLQALEEGITTDAAERPLPIDSKIQLYHGKHFTIGQTVFTYVEKDV